ncbi:cytochrome P450 [Sistotremastrum niveocremeum HHB9708]|uniref:Cytochrome P450 n=1 Tax=Sistotremastrum niveocremeum HHB9708 TaxID=1314777 RepID=A0A164TMA9_9AGAM|nr:cytochrome P450 [Sistotremastrum niveocremeum HHB9708]
MFTLLLFALAGLVLTLSTSVFFYYQKSNSLANIRGPLSTSWLYGNMREFSLGEYGVRAFQWQKLYGSVYKLMNCFGERRLVVADQKALQFVLGNPQLFPRAPEHKELARILMGQGIFWAEGPDHKRHRTVMQPSFAASQLRALFPCFQETARMLASQLQNKFSTNEENVVEDICPWLHKAALDIIGTAAFGHPFNSLLSDENAVARSYHNLLADSMTRGPLSIVVDAILQYMPVTLLRLFDKLPTKAMRKLRTNRALTLGLAKDLVERKLEVLKGGMESEKDVLSQIVHANVSQDPQTKMTPVEVYSQVSTIMLAGEETVANTAIWALYELAQDSELQDKVREEIRETYAAAHARGDTDLCATDLDNMPLTTAVMKETLRFHPALPMSLRKAAEDSIVPLAQSITTVSGEVVNEILIPADTIVIANSAGYNRLESVWGPDAHLFNISRWAKERKISHDATLGMYANLATFLSGPRGCIGYRFALIEFQMFLIELLKTFRFSIPPGIRIKRELALVTIPVVDGDPTRSQRMPLQLSLVEE